MKSERRHELVTNELADWVGNFPKFVRENRNMIIYVIVAAVVVAVVAYMKYGERALVEKQEQAKATATLQQLNQRKAEIYQGRITGMAVSDALIFTANKLESTAAGIENQLLAALAQIKQADTLRVELHYRTEPAEKQVVEYQLNQAKEAYESALEKAEGDATIASMAKFGIGLCAEEAGNFAQALRIYEDLATNDKFAGTIAAAAVIALQMRLE